MADWSLPSPARQWSELSDPPEECIKNTGAFEKSASREPKAIEDMVPAPSMHTLITLLYTKDATATVHRPAKTPGFRVSSTSRRNCNLDGSPGSLVVKWIIIRQLQATSGTESQSSLRISTCLFLSRCRR